MTVNMGIENPKLGVMELNSSTEPNLGQWRRLPFFKGGQKGQSQYSRPVLLDYRRTESYSPGGI